MGFFFDRTTISEYLSTRMDQTQGQAARRDPISLFGPVTYYGPPVSINPWLRQEMQAACDSAEAEADEKRRTSKGARATAVE